MQQFMSLVGAGAGAVVREIVEVPDGLRPGIDLFTPEFAATLVPFVAGVEPGYVEQADGSYAAPSPPPPVAPKSCSRLGLKRALDELGLWSKVKAMIAANDDMQEEWDLATELRITDPIVQKAIAGLALIGVSLTPDQVAHLMIRANALVA